MKRAIRFLLIALFIVALAAGGVWLYRSRTAAQASAAASSYTQVVEVKQGSLRANLSVVGELAAVQSEDLSFEKIKSATQLASLAVETGNTVKAGQVLATIDAASYQQALDQARSDLQAAEEKLADLKTPVTAQQIAKADVAIAKAENQFEQAKKDLADLQAPDLTALQRAVRDAQSSLALAQLQQTLGERDALAKSERDLQYAVGWHQRKIAQLEDVIAQGKANLEQTQLLAAERETLAQTQADLARVSSQRELALRTAAAEVTKAQATLADAQEALATARAGGDPLALAKARVALREAEVALAAAREARTELDEGTDATALAAAQADVDKKRLALADAEAALAGTKLVAPFDGTVLRTSVKVGGALNANTRVLTIANLKELQVLASVDETKIRQVKAGQSATLSFDALPGQSFRGQVLSVPLQGALQGNVMVYEVPVSLTGAANQPLLVGMTANVQIALGQVENALLIPAMAVTRASGRNQVLVPNAADPQGEPEAVPVEIGLSDGVNTQIVKGLNLGDKVVMQMASTAQNNPFNFGGGGGAGIMREAIPFIGGQPGRP